MNNLKKVGLSALAGSLVAFSANAVEMSVSGVAEVTYTTDGGNAGGHTGNAWGSNTSLTFSGTGDVGFGEATIVRTLNDRAKGASTATHSNYVSAYQLLDMGSMGRLSFDAHGGGLDGIKPWDDVLPTAYEEVWNGVSSHGVGTAAASNDTIGYRNTFSGVTVSLARTSGGDSNSGDGGNDDATDTRTTDVMLVANGSAIGIDGLEIGIGNSTAENPTAGETNSDSTTTLGHIKYSTGPVSVGYRMADDQSGTKGANGHTTDAYAIAFAVNENLSISYASQDREFDRPSTTNVTESSDAINASYTMGAASFRATIADSSNTSGVTGDKNEHMELSVVLAF
jgi:outer membrane protein OmpU